MAIVNTTPGPETSGRPERISFWLDSTTTAYTATTMGAPFYYSSVNIHVTEAFDNSAALIVGDSGDDNGYITSLAITSTGVKSPTLGAFNGYNGDSRTVTAAISNTPTVGKALVILEFFRVPRQV